MEITMIGNGIGLDYIGNGYCNYSWALNFNCEEFDYDGGDCIHGCTDSQSCNYNHEATYNNGTCEYISCTGCLDSNACNYNPNVLINDYETCIYPGEIEFIEHTNNLFLKVLTYSRKERIFFLKVPTYSGKERIFFFLKVLTYSGKEHQYIFKEAICLLKKCQPYFLMVQYPI